MKNKEKEQNAQKEEKKEKQDQWTLGDGRKFLKELREMPYDNSKVGQVFITLRKGRLPEKKNQETNPGL